MANNQFIRFSLALNANQYLQVYRGAAKTISAKTNDGRRIEFPAQNVQAFLTHDGIFGQFEIELTCENKFVAIKKIS